jgi:hypothetical protein
MEVKNPEPSALSVAPLEELNDDRFQASFRDYLLRDDASMSRPQVYDHALGRFGPHAN